MAVLATRSHDELPKLLGEHLLAEQSLSAADLKRAAQVSGETAQRLGPLLLKLGMLSEDDLVAAYAAVLGCELTDAADYPPSPVVHEALREQFLREAHIVPLRLTDDFLEVATADPENTFALNALRMALGRPVAIKLASFNQVERQSDVLYGKLQRSSEQQSPDAAAHEVDDVERLRDLAVDAPIVNLVNRLIERAIESRSSDIHVEPFENRLRTRYRIDGMLRETESVPLHSAPAIVSRIKLMANMDIAERRLPQDGRIQFRHRGKMIDLRVSSVPTIFGESVVLRVLDRDRARLDLTALGFSASIAGQLRQLLSLPNGIVLVTGPTGSGKTTTLYAALRHLNNAERKILTVEEPVEYLLDGINQIPARPEIGLDFAAVLRSIVRQDPDVIMIGEMRDLETSRIAVRSALTGHLVLSTLHTNDAGSSITRLVDMGVEPFLVTSTVCGILAQRLVRCLCSDCRARVDVPPGPLADRMASLGIELGASTFYRPIGCDACNGSGYRGRVVIGELLPMSDALRQAILSQTDGATLQRLAIEAGMQTIAADGLRKVAAGTTTIAEVERVAFI
jgi:general secretion pathway protein E